MYSSEAEFFISEEKYKDFHIARILAENIFSEDVLAGDFKSARSIPASLLDRTSSIRYQLYY